MDVAVEVGDTAVGLLTLCVQLQLCTVEFREHLCVEGMCCHALVHSSSRTTHVDRAFLNYESPIPSEHCVCVEWERAIYQFKFEPKGKTGIKNWLLPRCCFRKKSLRILVEVSSNGLWTVPKICIVVTNIFRAHDILWEERQGASHTRLYVHLVKTPPVKRVASKHCHT